MPKQGFSSITVPEELDNRVGTVVERSNGLIQNKSQALANAWQLYEHLGTTVKNPRPIKIGNKLISHDAPIFVIAEIGINHIGDMDICKKLIDMAIESGCDAVKFQKRTINIVYTKKELEKPRESPFGTTNGDLKRGLEFGEKEYREIDEYCKKKGIMWFSSPWDVDSVDFLEKFDLPCYKIASACLTDKALLERVKETGKPIILSSGMSTMQQVKKAMDILGEENTIFLHCTSTYPSDVKELNLNCIPEMRKIFNCPIGYSGHEPGVDPTIMAMTLGACVVERHITLDRSMYGSDQAASLERKGLEKVCKIAQIVPDLIGNGHKCVYDSEVPIIQKLRRIDTI